MQKTSTIRNIASLGIAAITIWMVFSQGIIPAVMFAGFCFFGWSLVEIFQRRDALEQRRLILMTVSYTLCIMIIVAYFLWRYRALFFIR